jgi:hypothetical protein
MAFTGNGGLGFDSGEGAWQTATTSTEGSRRVNYPKSWLREVVIRNNESGFIPSFTMGLIKKLNIFIVARNNWRASLVPAAAVIPAPIAYIKVVAVNKARSLNFWRWQLAGDYGHRRLLPPSSFC